MLREDLFPRGVIRRLGIEDDTVKVEYDCSNRQNSGHYCWTRDDRPIAYAPQTAKATRRPCYTPAIMATPFVHVIIINWNGLEHLQDCYDSLLAGSYENVRYVLLDNASEDDSVAFVRDTYGDDERVEIVECDRNLGWSGGNNVGIRRALEANADYVFLLNNDTATAPDAMEHLVAMAEANPQLGCIAPKMLLFDEPGILNSVGLACSVIGACWDIGLGRLDGAKWASPEPVIGACGGAAFFRSEAIRKSGLLPEEFGIYLDDLDLCLRIWKQGYEIQSCPGATVRHKFSATMGSGKRLRHKYYLNTRNRSRLVMRNWPREAVIKHLPDFAKGEIRSVGRAGLNGELWKAAAHARSWISAARYATGHRPGTGSTEDCPFWPLVTMDPLFFPGAELPQNGWYEPRMVQGRTLCPISRAATLDVPAGPLRVTHANCYPHLGEAEVRVTQYGNTIATLTTSNIETVILKVQKGEVRFESDRIFDAEDTGEKADFGGWLKAEPI